MENHTQLLVALQKRVRELEDALTHQRQVTAAAEMRCRALETSQGLNFWRATLQGRRAPESTSSTPIKPHK